MAKKFFHDRVYNAKKNIINAIIIGVCIIGVIVCFIVVSNSNIEGPSNNNRNVTLKEEVWVEINDPITKDIFFTNIENVDLNEIKIDFADDITKIGEYEVKIIIDDKEYKTILNVIDTTNPELILKDVSIDKGKTYISYDFVESCVDNSGENCIISFFNTIDEDGNEIDYSKFTEPGDYEIKILAKDSFGNEITKSSKLTIKSNTTTSKPKPVTCKYGDGIYNTENYLLAVNVISNNCAISLDLYNDNEIMSRVNKIMDTETTKIKKDIEALKLSGTLALNRKVTAVTNTSANGIVGYEIKMIVTITNNDVVETIAEYKVNSDGKRIFTTNPHKLK